MATDTVLMEIAEAEADGLKSSDIANFRGAIATMGNVGMAYTVPDTDKAAWVPAYKLTLDFAGVERGTPVPLPKDRLGYYLSKKREVDGGRLFTMKMPEHLAGERKFQCFIVPNVCQSKMDTKSNLVDHMENAHPRESLNYKRQIDQIRDAAMLENTALNDLVSQIVSMPDQAIVYVAPAVREEHDAQIETVEVEAPVQVSIIRRLACPSCAWTSNDNHKRPEMALKMHIMGKHKEDAGGE